MLATTTIATCSSFPKRRANLVAQALWHDWFPSIWLDEHQQGQTGPRIFTMPARDPINPNVDPLIYRLNSIYGQAQAAALEAEGKEGIIFDANYTNFWEGAMAWAGWWHNEVGLLTEVASARIATPTVQQKPDPAHTSANEAAQNDSQAPGADEFVVDKGPDRAAPRTHRHQPTNRISPPLDGRYVALEGHRRLRTHGNIRACSRLPRTAAKLFSAISTTSI